VPLVAPYRESLEKPGAASLPSTKRAAPLLLAVALTVLLVAPVVALAMQPFSMVATLVAGSLATVAATTYARICFSR
jgi:hypothetical protein